MTDHDIAFVIVLVLLSIWIVVSYYGLKLENEMIAHRQKRKRENDHAKL